MNPSPDGNDEVEFYVSNDSPRGTVTVVLRTGPAISWWKGIKVFGNNSWFAIGLLETQYHAHGPSSVTMKLGEFIPGQARLEFWKSKGFGVHTDMAHYTFDPKQFAGKTLNFSWLTDR
jgi:hypothetical protein